LIAPYIAIAATGTPAAARLGGVLRWYLLWEVVWTCGLKLAFIHFQHWDENAHRMVWPLYPRIWAVAEPLGMVLAGCAVLTRCKPRWWVAVPALGIHLWASGFADRWPGFALHGEIHAVAFCCLLFGLALIGERKNAAVAVLFLGTAAALYPVPWHPAIRGWLMYFQSTCYCWIALTTRRHKDTMLPRYLPHL